jgi:signal peptide peptidase SppA
MRGHRLFQKLYAEPLMVRRLNFDVFASQLDHVAATRAMRPDDDEDETEERKIFCMVGNVMVIPIHGPIDRSLSAMDRLCSDATDVLDVQEALRVAEESPDVLGVVLDVNSPGGSVLGVEETAAMIARLSKPSIAHIGGLGCSAAYFIAAGARAVYSDPSSIVGSIGVYCAILDQSRRYDREGVSVDVVKSEGSPLKGAGIPGTSLSVEQRAAMQAQVDHIYAKFAGFVSSRRKVKPEALNGGDWTGDVAKDLGLVDSLANLNTAIRDVLRIG